VRREVGDKFLYLIAGGGRSGNAAFIKQFSDGISLLVGAG
jgi:hypothetical protein